MSDSIDILRRHPREALRFADLVDRAQATEEEIQAISGITADQWVGILQRSQYDPVLREAASIARNSRDLRAVAATSAVQNSVADQLTLSGIVIGVVTSVLVFIASLMIAIISLGMAIVSGGAALPIAIITLIIAVISAIAIVGTVLGLVVFLLPAAAVLASAVGTTITGGMGGVPFLDNVSDVKDISMVVVRHRNDLVHCVQLVWLLHDGTHETSELHGCVGWNGDTTNMSTEVLTLNQTGQYITKITGRSGIYIDQVTIHTNSQSWGPFGGDGGSEFELNPDFGDRIYGFHGRAGAVLDALGVCSPVYASGLHGGGGGDPFLDALAAGARIKSLTIEHGDFVNSLQVEWVDSTGERVVGVRHGGAGRDRTVMTFDDDESISTVTVRSGQYVNGLAFVTTKNRTFTFGGEGGTEFKISVDPGERIVGFFGRSGELLDAIGVCAESTTRRRRLAGGVHMIV